MWRLITNEISNHLVLTATMLDVYFAIKNVTPERSDTSTYPTGLRVIGAVAERPHYENPLCLHWGTWEDEPWSWWTKQCGSGSASSIYF
jgi:hypothetical protein